MQRRAPLGGIDFLAGGHAPAPAFNVGLAGQINQQRISFGTHPVLGIIEEQPAQAHRHRFEPVFVVGEQVPHVQAGGFLAVGFERLPGGRTFQGRHGENNRFRRGAVREDETTRDELPQPVPPGGLMVRSVGALDPVGPADDDHGQLVRAQQLLRQPVDVVEGHRLDKAVAAVGIINAEVVHLDTGQHRGDAV